MSSRNIRQLTIYEFDQVYELWTDEAPVAISNEDFNINDKHQFYIDFFENALLNQTESFKYWGYFVGDVLLAWHSLLLCQAAPIPYHLFAETSLYIRGNFRAKGLGQMLMNFSINEARLKSSSAYILGTCSRLNKKSQHMLNEVGFAEIGTVPYSSKENVLVAENNWMIWFYIL